MSTLVFSSVVGVKPTFTRICRSSEKVWHHKTLRPCNSGQCRWKACATSSTNCSTSREGQWSPSLAPYFQGTANLPQFSPHEVIKGWDDSETIALLRLLATTAADRSEMHSILAIQKDNWGKLLQVTVTMSMISAGVLSAINCRTESAFSLSLTASLLAVVSALFMGLESWFQPSQLAEEHRAAARFFKGLTKEIESSLKLSNSHLKEDARLFYMDKLDKLHALDGTYPMTLFSGATDKFPKQVEPVELSYTVDKSHPEVTVDSSRGSNGWTPAIVEDLKNASALMRESDMSTYVTWAEEMLQTNTILAISAPALATISVVANFVQGGAVVAAVCSVVAAFAHSLSHDGQVGMVFELYRTVAGYYKDVDRSIQRNLRLPVEKREDGGLFHQRIALQLGRKQGQQIIDGEEKTAGKLF